MENTNDPKLALRLEVMQKRQNDKQKKLKEKERLAKIYLDRKGHSGKKNLQGIKCWTLL